MTSPGRPRITALDVLRGFTLCEILLANIQLIANAGRAVVAQPMGDWDPWLGLPIFSLLFGIGFSLLLDSAANRVPRPRLVLLRRLLTLLAIGLVHALLWRGEILTSYAIVGLLVLLPSTWLPRWAVAGLAPALVAAALISGGGGPLLIAGLFLLGSALVRYGVIERIERSIRGPLLLGLIFAAGAASARWVQANVQAGAGTTQLSFTSSLADLLLAGVYVCALLVLLRTPLRPALQAVFTPLGRMALTNYLTATLLVLAASHILGLPIGQSLTAAYLAAGAILTAQWLFSTLWLRRYRQGPIEWLWRWATWGHRSVLRIPTS
ncbi:DUF418 domain-containing protein [Nonomuraea turkmeniaca]|uniref:DUF418 domain-containing protein n=1 Tax=Nonomuraea turkmeniaca TaxID=103838 RepID=A0A5S4EX04_9ACTN|nr:DUF418 domain-containing protein [Nonomuraea turkmeniaca]TMR08182.1 DUF418 domain-containing protein [Nonomuraea turkmeniaca]